MCFYGIRNNSDNNVNIDIVEEKILFNATFVFLNKM